MKASSGKEIKNPRSSGQHRMTYLLHRHGRQVVNWQNARQEREHKSPRTLRRITPLLTSPEEYDGLEVPVGLQPKAKAKVTSRRPLRSTVLRGFHFGRTNYSKITTIYSVLTPSTMLLRQPVPFGSSRAAA